MRQKMNYIDNNIILKAFYARNGLLTQFDKDSAYLEEAFNGINTIWLDNLSQIKTVNYLMIAEAPLWGKEKKYIYNPDINNSQFFFRSDLGDILNRPIADKPEFIRICNEIGLLVIDISPFPLNPKITSINYRDITTTQYKQLVNLTIPTYFEEKVKIIGAKKSENIKTFFRYARVKNTFQDMISKVLVENQFIKTQNDILEISQKGGGIDKKKLKQIIKMN